MIIQLSEWDHYVLRKAIHYSLDADYVDLGTKEGHTQMMFSPYLRCIVSVAKQLKVPRQTYSWSIETRKRLVKAVQRMMRHEKSRDDSVGGPYNPHYYNDLLARLQAA